MENIILESKYDNYKLHLLISEVSSPKGIIHMIHGMEEYKERYIYFIEKLNQEGYTCVISDMRGHGRHLSDEELGYFSKKNPNKALILDQETILEYIKNKYINVPILLFSHSMGTIISRNLLQNNSKYYQKVILCGAPCYNSMCHLGVFIANTICLKKDKEKAKLLANLALGGYVKSVKNRKTHLDWLSISDENVKNYKDDHFCGFGFKNNGYKALFKLMSSMNKKLKNKDNIPEVLLIVGEGDPVPGFSKGRKDIVKRLYKQGYNIISTNVVLNARHEILNEVNKDSSIETMIKFYKG